MYLYYHTHKNLKKSNIPTMLKYNLKIFSICKYSSGRLRLWSLPPTTYMCWDILCILYLIPFFRDKYLFYSFEHSQNHIILLCGFNLCIYTAGLIKAVFYSISPTCQATCKLFQKLWGILWFRLCFCVHYPGESPGHVATLAHVLNWCTRSWDASNGAVLPQGPKYQLCRWKGKELLMTA